MPRHTKVSLASVTLGVHSLAINFSLGVLILSEVSANSIQASDDANGVCSFHRSQQGLRAVSAIATLQSFLTWS